MVPKRQQHVRNQRANVAPQCQQPTHMEKCDAPLRVDDLRRGLMRVAEGWELPIFTPAQRYIYLLLRDTSCVTGIAHVQLP